MRALCFVGEMVVSASEDHTLRVFDIASAQTVSERHFFFLEKGDLAEHAEEGLLCPESEKSSERRHLCSRPFRRPRSGPVGLAPRRSPSACSDAGLGARRPSPSAFAVGMLRCGPRDPSA